VTLPAFAAERRLLLSSPATGTRRRRPQLSVDISCRQGSLTSKLAGRRRCRRSMGQTDRQTNRRMDGQTPDRYTDPASCVQRSVDVCSTKTTVHDGLLQFNLNFQTHCGIGQRKKNSSFHPSVLIEHRFVTDRQTDRHRYGATA